MIWLNPSAIRYHFISLSRLLPFKGMDPILWDSFVGLWLCENQHISVDPILLEFVIQSLFI